MATSVCLVFVLAVLCVLVPSVDARLRPVRDGASNGHGHGHVAHDVPSPLKSLKSGQCFPEPYIFGDYNYCGANFYTSETYPMPTPIAGYTWTLRGVQMVTRHGDRTPVSVMPVTDVSYPFCGTTASLGFYAHDPVKGAHEGRRLEEQPITSQPSVANPYAARLWQGNCMQGQLTSRGISQLADIGAGLRTVYVDKLGFLPPTYSREKTDFYLRSTDVWRTRQSAESLLSGLWPASDLDSDDVIPLHVFPAEVETMYGNTYACDALAAIQNAQSASAPWVDHLQVPDKWAVLDDAFGVAGRSDWHQGFDHQYDNLQTRICHGLPLPCSRTNSSNCVTDDLAKWVFGQGDWEYRFMFNESPLATRLAQVGMGAFMSVIRDVIRAQISGDSNVSTIGAPAFAYYSGHDTTIAAVLGALNITGFQWPPYASNMQFELWQLDASSGPTQPTNYAVRVLYNGAVLPMYAAGCCDDLCPSNDFIAYLDSMIPNDLVQQCAKKSQ